MFYGIFFLHRIQINLLTDSVCDILKLPQQLIIFVCNETLCLWPLQISPSVVLSRSLLSYVRISTLLLIEFCTFLYMFTYSKMCSCIWFIYPLVFVFGAFRRLSLTWQSRMAFSMSWYSTSGPVGSTSRLRSSALSGDTRSSSWMFCSLWLWTRSSSWMPTR